MESQQILPWKQIGLITAGITVGAVILLLSFKWFFAILIMGTGFTMVWKTVWWLDMFGRNPWAEKFLGSGGWGGSWLFYKLLGIVVMVGAFLYATGLLQTIFVGTLGKFFGYGQ